MLIFMIIYVLIGWGFPFLLVSVAWWRYQHVRSISNREMFLLRASMALLTLSGLILLCLGVILLVKIPTLSLTPQMLGLVGVILCGASLLTPLAAKRNATTTQAWKSIVYANVYLVLLWCVLMLAR